MVNTTQTKRDLYNLVDMTLEMQDFGINAECYMSGIFQEKPKGDHTGDTERFEEYSAQQYVDTVPELGDVPSFQSTTGYAIDVVLDKYATNVVASFEAYDYDKYSTFMDDVESALRATIRSFDLDLQHRIAFYDQTGYTNRSSRYVDLRVGDGKTLGNAAHTVLHSPLTYNNLIAGNPKFSRTAYELAVRQWNSNTIDHWGVKLSQKPNVIITTDEPTTCAAVGEFLNSIASVTSPNANVTNVYKDKLRHIPLSRLNTNVDGSNNSNKDYMWAIAYIAKDGWQAKYTINRMPYRGKIEETGKNDQMFIPIRMRAGIGVLSGRFILISGGN